MHSQLLSPSSGVWVEIQPRHSQQIEKIPLDDQQKILSLALDQFILQQEREELTLQHIDRAKSCITAYHRLLPQQRIQNFLLQRNINIQKQIIQSAEQITADCLQECQTHAAFIQQAKSETTTLSQEFDQIRKGIEEFNKKQEEAILTLQEEFVQYTSEIDNLDISPMQAQVSTLSMEYKELAQDFQRNRKELQQTEITLQEIRQDQAQIGQDFEKIRQDQTKIGQDQAQLRQDFEKIGQRQELIRKDFQQHHDDFEQFSIRLEAIERLDQSNSHKLEEVQNTTKRATQAAKEVAKLIEEIELEKAHRRQNSSVNQNNALMVVADNQQLPSKQKLSPTLFK